jgi:hypothetical protein
LGKGQTFPPLLWGHRPKRGGPNEKGLLLSLHPSLVLFLPSASFASSGLDSFIKSLNVQAQADLGAFKVRLWAQFGIPVPKVEFLMVKVATPGDAYMRLRIGQVASQPIEAVIKEYQSNKGKGWGVMAKSLG